MNDVHQASALRPLLFNAFNNGIGRGVRCTLSKFAEDTKLNGAGNMPVAWDATQRDIDKLKKWACGSIIRFKKALHLGWDKPQYP